MSSFPRVQLTPAANGRRRPFCGVGFHVFDHDFERRSDGLDRVVAESWNVLRPRFARLNHSPRWSAEQRARFVAYLQRFQDAGTTVYVTTWGPPDVRGADLERYAEQIAAELAGYVFDHGCTNLRFYCMSNELTLGKWGTLMHDLPRFREYHQALHDAFARRQLPVGLLATDAAPLHRWHSLEWAVEHMDDISEAYGGHDYFSDHLPDDPSFYPWFQRRMDWAMNIFGDSPKPFIIGECGPKQDGRVIDGVTHDTSIHWGTPQEPWVGIQMAEAVIAAVNAGMHAVGYWTFCDFPDDYSPTYRNKWGVIRWDANGFSTRAPYYALGLMTRYFAGGETLGLQTSDPLVRAAALQLPDGGHAVTLVNRREELVDVEWLPAASSTGRPWRQYGYDPRAVPSAGGFQLPPGAALPGPPDGALRARVPAGSLAVFTTQPDS